MEYRKNLTTFSDLIYNNLSYENIVEFILNTKNEYEFFQKGYVYLDEFFYSKTRKNLSIDEQIQILNMLDIYKARYSDQVYIEALFSEPEIQNWVKTNLPRKYSDRHIEDTETY
jgi:hypothetical protein